MVLQILHSYLMITFFLILGIGNIWITISDLSQMIGNGPAVRSACSFITLRCCLSGAMELHMSKWFKRSSTQSVCQRRLERHWVSQPLPCWALDLHYSQPFFFFFPFCYPYKHHSCCCFYFAPACTPGLSENLLTCSGNVTQVLQVVLTPSLFQQHPRQHNCSGRAHLQAFLLLPQVAKSLDLSFSAAILGVSIYLPFECNV